MTPIQASLKKNEGFVYNNLLDKSEKRTQKLQVSDLLRTADLKKMFSRGDTNNWSSKLYKNTQFVTDTIPSQRIDNLLERYNESLLKKTDLAMKENKDVMQKLNIT